MIKYFFVAKKKTKQTPLSALVPTAGDNLCRSVLTSPHPVMQLCFGAEIAAEQLMDQAGFQEACQLLYGPLLAQLR